jgi:protein-S-isoprenylcysteine O-methyltransferase
MQESVNITGAIWIVFWLFWLVSAIMTSTRTERRAGFTYPVGILFLLVAIGVLFGSGWAGNGFLLSRFVPDEPAIAITGILITVAGLLFAVWARVHLGRNWSGSPTIKVGHQLIRSGPYRYVRNPIYTGILVGLIGTALVIGMWIVVFAVGVGVVAFLLKIRAEEELLMEKFGDEYMNYKREVKSLIPFVI